MAKKSAPKKARTAKAKAAPKAAAKKERGGEVIARKPSVQAVAASKPEGKAKKK